MRWRKQGQRKVLRNRWKLLHGTMYGLGVKDGTHAGKEMSEPKKTGSTGTKELSEELLLPANSRGKSSLWAGRTLLWLQGPQQCHRRQGGTGEDSKHYPWTASSTKAAASVHLHTSTFHPAPDTVQCPVQDTVPPALHRDWFFSPVLPALQAPANTPLGAADHPHSFKSNKEENRAFSELSSTSTTQTLSPSAAPASEDSDKMR